jgi:hypothetical protein
VTSITFRPTFWQSGSHGQFEKTCPANLRWIAAGCEAYALNEPLANLKLDAITSEHAADFACHEMTRGHAPHVTRVTRCDVRTLARIAGHSSIQTSTKYVHPDEHAVLDAMAKLHEPRELAQ